MSFHKYQGLYPTRKYFKINYSQKQAKKWLLTSRTNTIRRQNEFRPLATMSGFPIN